MNIIEEQNKKAAKSRLISGLSILVADDSLDNLAVVESCMKNWGIQIKTATDGVEALNKASKSKFDLILMDLHMPNMNGYEATRSIRAYSNNQQTPIVAFTTETQFNGSDIMPSLIFNASLKKPFTSNELFSLITRFSNVPV